MALAAPLRFPRTLTDEAYNMLQDILREVRHVVHEHLGNIASYVVPILTRLLPFFSLFLFFFCVCGDGGGGSCNEMGTKVRIPLRGEKLSFFFGPCIVELFYLYLRYALLPFQTLPSQL